MPKTVIQKEASTTQLSVDFPEQGEKITSPRYALRLSVPEGVKRVDVAIDQGDWKPCRNTGGHWWYDWSGYESGEHEVVSRIETEEGLRISSEPREFFVRL